MQSADAKPSRNSLLLALRRYSSAVHTMEQTVLLPSLLRDVPHDDGSSDLYESYLMLRALRTAVESGLVPFEDSRAWSSTVPQKGLVPFEDSRAWSPTVPHDESRALSPSVPQKGLVPLLEAEPEALLHFHLRGLFSVMASLTQTSHNLTQKYLEIIGISR